jgi:hypothetical protein
MNGLSAVRNRYSVKRDPLRTERRIELVVILLALLLIVQLVYGAIRLAVMSRPEAVEPTADSLQVMTSLGPEEITEEQSSEIRNRPLLWPGRRPIETIVDNPAVEKVQQQEVEGITLLGVFGTGESVGIIVRIKDKTQRFHVGQEMHGWTLESVGTNEAVITAGKRRETLILKQVPIKPAGKVGKRSERKK